jgi:carbon monoxide dehydrogenase subunit G
LTQEIQASIEIQAPIEVVWDTIHDPAVFVEGIDWVFDAWWEAPGPVGRGSVYVERAKPGLRTGTHRWELTVFDPPHRAVHSHRGGELEADLELTLEPRGERRTRYTQRMRFRALPRFRPLGALLERTVMKRQMRRDFERMILPNYKRIAERRAAG